MGGYCPDVLNFPPYQFALLSFLPLGNWFFLDSTFYKVPIIDSIALLFRSECQFSRFVVPYFVNFASGHFIQLKSIEIVVEKQSGKELIDQLEF